MRVRSSAALAAVLHMAAAHAAKPGEPSIPIDVTVDAGAPLAAHLSRHLYGQFLEHIGPIVNHGLWSEMLDDRKFYGPLFDAEPPPPSDARIVWRGTTRNWIRIGSASAVDLDRREAYVGEQALRLSAHGLDPVGVRQNGLTVAKGKQYRGHIVVSGDVGVVIRVSLGWGESSEAAQTLSLPPLTANYVEYPLEFNAPVTSGDARLTITATGSGVARVGAVSLMPADNVEGFRAEAVAALKRIDAGVYRFPGGNFVSAHEWRNAIGPRDKRPPIFDPVWRAVQPNDVGTDEFLTLSRLLGVDPYITVNAGFGDAWSAAQLVEYCNGNVTTPMGRLRASNGHAEPYGVKLWGIGNEPWGEWQFGAMPAAQYVYKHNDFAKAMRSVDPSITLVAGGAMPDAMTGSRQSLRFGPSLIPEPLSAADWTGMLLLHSIDYMDQISEHYYSYASTRFDLSAAKQVPVDSDEPLIDWMRRPANHVRMKYEAWQDYRERIPALRDKSITINIDEWAMSGLPPSAYKLVPAYAWSLHEMFRHPDVFQGAAFTFATSLLNTTRNQAELNPAGLVFELYSRHYGTIPVRVRGNRPPPAPRYPPGGEEPKVNAGSDTSPLDVAAAWSEDRRRLVVAVINPTDSAQTMRLTIEGARLARGGRLRRIAYPDLDYVATPGTPSAVKIAERPLAKLPAEIVVPRFSVSLYEFPNGH